MNFMEEIKAGFEIGKVSLTVKFSFNGYMIKVSDGYSELNIRSYKDRISLLLMTRGRKHQREECTSESAEKLYRTLEGTIMVLPKASLVSCKIQQRVGFLKVKHLVE